VLWFIGRWTTPPGTIFWSFLAGYGVCRLIVEFFREPDQHIGFILGSVTMGQLLSAPMVMVGLIMVARGFYRAVPEQPPKVNL
jgi:phosphatidylglycerol:prolipoprotein diacylglycerol transferase